MAGDRLSDEDLHNLGRYAIGSRGYRPVVSLPETHALRLIKIKQYTETLAILLFLMSALLFFTNEVGDEVPTVIGAFVIGFRGIIILLSHVIVAKTTVFEVAEPTEPTQGSSQIEGAKRSSRTMPGVNLEAQVKNSQLHIRIKNHRAKSLYFGVEVSSESGVIDVYGDERILIIPPKGAGGLTHSELTIDLASTGSDGEQSDILNVEVFTYLHVQADEQHSTRLGEFSIPVTISGSNEMFSEVVTREYKFEILDN